ncbi:hypothetical protein CAC42_4979 [Sphaceloma murrayae]|uniref:mitogen-activated protein kinase kinase kinase n=1 Tax=Sphaceloma murrayae TaxID=2082308 RepID=A0A2K1QPL3_9PEZI|nr:hypothetical protein CAC42_4979 [Sphaceloma murrayae]
MAMLASRSQYPGPLGNSNGAYRQAALAGAGQGVFASPTESEFSESYDTSDAVSTWDEGKVGDWLKSINCAQYVELFQKHNINGENLVDLDQSTLKELGVNKVGDRVRINAQAKLFRATAARRTSQRTINRQSLAILDSNTHISPSSASPRAMHSARNPATSRADKRLSRHFDPSQLGAGSGSSRPSSPMVEGERSTRGQKYAMASPHESAKREQANSYFVSGTKSKQGSVSSETPQTARFPAHTKGSPSIDNLSASHTVLPFDKPLIRVVFDNGRSSVVNIAGCTSAEQVIHKTLRKGMLDERYVKNYCFYILEGTDPNPAYCRRLGDSELVQICNNRVRSERSRLILRKIHAGEPEGEQLRVAAKLAEQQPPSPPPIEVHQPSKTKSQMKVEQMLGESISSLPSVTYPMSPASEHKTRAYFEGNLKRTESGSTTASARARKLKDFYGQRPPTELITQDLTSYFPDVEKEKMDRTVRMSIRRSQRLSRAASRISTASNLSFASSLKDAPPLPTIADSWLNGNGQKPLRPLSVMRLGRPQSDYRDSVALSVLEPLNEDSAFEPSRKSYVSFGEGSGSDSNGMNSNTATSTDMAGNTIMRSYFDDSGATVQARGDDTASLNSRLSRFIAEDSEEDDEELMEHLEQDSWENLKYMKGAMIGQGSFGTVYLALHAITGELMALKQVEMPSSNNTSLDAKKNNMVEALKREIDLLRELKHPNIVQYLGSNSDDTHLNIFLEYVAGGSVATMLVNYGSLPEPLISNFVRQILHGLAYLHSKDIIHRDIKGANILVDNHGSVKISDFGISKRVESTLRTSSAAAGVKGRAGPRVSLQGSVFWMAPEVVKQTAYTRKADIWSLGCLIVEMMTGSHPHPNCTQLQAIFKIGGSGEARPDIPATATKEVRTFLERTFEIEHEKRPTADELLGFEFVGERGLGKG